MSQQKKYTIKLIFTNMDENLNTPHEASMDFKDVYADDLVHADLLAKRLEKTFGADDYRVEAAV